ncbi:MAG: hypothetical protein EP329_00520, partial [Deltaproteobacteria bacterium]
MAEPAAPAPAAPAATAAALGDAPVQVLDTGHWSKTVACSGFCVNEVHFWVDLKVRNDAYQKEVGILWTDNGWASVKTAMAVYEKPLEDGWEQWGVDVTVGTMASYMTPHEIEVAAFARMAGAAYWDPGNNYYIYNSVTLERPVRRLSSEVHMEAGKGVVMTGRVRVLDLAFDKVVAVRYTTDGWATWDEAQAYWVADDDWEFRAENVAQEPLPDKVDYAVRYEVLGEEHWDNNGGSDFHHRLAPVFSQSYTFANTSAPISGVLVLGGSFQSDLPISQLHTRVDDGAWSEGGTLVFSTLDLADGAHQVEVRATLAGGGTVSDTVPFNVRNAITPLESWTPDHGNPDSVADAWALATDASGRIYLAPGSSWGAAGSVLRYDALGDATPSRVYPTLPSNRHPDALAVDADGRLYALGSYTNKALIRFTVAGTYDTTFGNDGVVDLSGLFDGASICYAGSVAVNAHHAYVTDTCHHRILRFTLDGAFDDALGMPDNGYPIPAGLFADADGVWVLRSHQIFRIDDAANQDMTHGEVIALSPTINNPQGLTRGADGVFWTGDGVSGVQAISAEGVRLAGWWGGGDYDLFGAFHLPQDVCALPGGDVVVLGASGPRLV